MRKKQGSGWNGAKIIYHAYRSSETMRAANDNGNELLHGAKETILFVLVLGAACGLLWVVASSVSFAVRMVN